MKLSKIAKSPLTYIAIAAAIAAFGAGLFVSTRMNDIAASGPREVREVVVEVPVTYRNPDGTWPSPIPTSASGPRVVVVEVDHTDSIIYRNPDGTWPSPVPTSTPRARLSDDYDPILEPDATGIETMGKLLYLVDGGRIQLPPDVYVAKFWNGGTCLDWTDCPEFPYVVLARGDDRVEIDRWGKPFHTWSVSSESAPSIESFEFLNE